MTIKHLTIPTGRKSRVLHCLFGALILKTDTGRGGVMDFRTYQQIRTYCCNDLRAYLDLPGYDAMRMLWGKLNGQVGLIQREQQLAISLHQCSDLTPRERAAAELLAVISNHRAIAWQREPEPPNGNEPAPPLEKIEADAMANQTRDAVKRYAAFLPEPERAVLLADCEAALEAAPDAAPAAAKVEAGQVTPGEDMEQEQVELSLTDVVRINEAAEVMGCTVEYLLREAGNDEHLLYVALKPHSAKLCAIPSHTNPQNGSYTTKSHKIVIMAQHYAESLAIAGSAEIAQYQAGFIKGGILDWHYWMLDVPQTVNVDMVFVPRSQLPDTPAAKEKDRGDVMAMQSLYGATKYTGDRPWLKNDSWGAELACKLIVFGYPVDMTGKGWDAVINWPVDKWGRKASIALRVHFDRAMGIAKSSVNADKIREHDSPANWIKWAKGKGYSVAHLMPAETKVEAETVTSASGAPKPWTIANPTDPQAEYDWYVYARYFARELIKADSTLLIKKELLAKKIVMSFKNAGIFKRGKTKEYKYTTILKAFVNVTFG